MRTFFVILFSVAALSCGMLQENITETDPAENDSWLYQETPSDEDINYVYESLEGAMIPDHDVIGLINATSSTGIKTMTTVSGLFGAPCSTESLLGLLPIATINGTVDTTLHENQWRVFDGEGNLVLRQVEIQNEREGVIGLGIRGQSRPVEIWLGACSSPNVCFTLARFSNVESNSFVWYQAPDSQRLMYVKWQIRGPYTGVAGRYRCFL